MRILASILAVSCAATLAACGDQTAGDPQEIVLYSARHYDSDALINQAFEEETGIRVRSIEADGDLLIERIRADGARSPADVVMTVDAGRLFRAEQEGLFQPVQSDVLESRIPANLRHPDGLWFGFSQRARIIVYAKDRVDPAQLGGYETLADPAWRGKVCVRSSGNIYNVSLLAALIARWGAEEAEQWAEGVVANLARVPSGGDLDQISAVIAGECDLALVNHYYLARMIVSDSSVADAVGVHWPEAGGGVHVNISGAGIAANAPNPEGARRYLEFLASDLAQRLVAETNGEYPVEEGVAYDNPVVAGFGTFETDPLNVAVLGENQAEAQRIFDRAGWP